MSDNETLSSYDNAEEDDEKYKLLIKGMLMCSFYSEACSSGVKSCQQDENTALHVYAKGIEKANALLRSNIYDYSLFDPDSMTIIEDEAKREIQPMIESLAATVGALERGDGEQSGVPSSSTNISVASTSSVSGVANGDNPPSQTPSNAVPAIPRTRRQRERVVYDEEEVKEQVRNVIEKVQEVSGSLNHPNESPHGIATNSPLLQMASCTLMEKISS